VVGLDGNLFRESKQVAWFKGFPLFAVSNSVDLSVGINTQVGTVVASQGNSTVSVFNSKLFPFFAVTNGVHVAGWRRVDTDVGIVVGLQSNLAMTNVFNTEVFPLFGVANNVQFLACRISTKEVAVP